MIFSGGGNMGGRKSRGLRRGEDETWLLEEFREAVQGPKLSGT